MFMLAWLADTTDVRSTAAVEVLLCSASLGSKLKSNFIPPGAELIGATDVLLVGVLAASWWVRTLEKWGLLAIVGCLIDTEPASGELLTLPVSFSLPTSIPVIQRIVSSHLMLLLNNTPVTCNIILLYFSFYNHLPQDCSLIYPFISYLLILKLKLLSLF